MRVADISWMEKPNRRRDRSNYLLIAAILAALLFIGYVSEHPFSITGFAVFGTDSATSIGFGRHTVPLGASVDLTIDGKTYTKNLVSILGQPYEIFYENATVYGWDADIVVPLESFDAVNTLGPGSHTIDAVLAANGEMLDMKTVTIEIGVSEPETKPETPPVADVPVPEPVLGPVAEAPAIESPATGEQTPAEPIIVPIIVPTITDPSFALAVPEFSSAQEAAAARLPILDGVDVASIPIVPSTLAPETPSVIGVNTFLATVSGEPVFKTYVQGECGGAIACNCTDIVTASRTLIFGTDFVTNGTCATFGLSVASGAVLDCGFNNITGDAGSTDIGVNVTVANSSVIGNCTIQKFGDNILGNTRSDNISVLDSYFINASSNHIDENAGANWTIFNNTFNESDGTLISLQGSYFRIKNNKFFDSKSGTGTPNGVTLDVSGTIYNNITNNTFNITTTSAVAVTWTVNNNNNSIWRNTFDTVGFAQDTRTSNNIIKNNFCVNDGSGAIGNRYLNGSGEYRVAKDCGPVPNIGTWNVDPTAAENIPFSLTNTPDAANFLTINDAAANVNATKSVINVSPVLNDTRRVFLDNADNVTLECNGAALAGPSSSSSDGIDIEDSFNATIQNCRFSRWTDAINLAASGATLSSDNIRIQNNDFNLSVSNDIELNDDLFDFAVIFNNTFRNSGGSAINSIGGGDNNTIKDNIFIGSNSSAHAIQFQSGNADWWNITNNTFNLTGTSATVVQWTSAAAANMSIWRNTLDGSGFHDLTRTSDAVAGSSFCVNDGSGRIGNLYVNGSASKRIGGDCGPTPNIGTWNVDPTSNGRVVFSLSADPAVANFTRISDAIGNVNATKSIVNVSPGRGLYNQTTFFKAVDNVTLECNSGELTGQGAGTTGIDIDESVNLTIQNCNFTGWGDAIVADAVGLAFSSDTVRIQNSRFENAVSNHIEIDDDLFDFAIIFNNTFRDSGGSMINSVSGSDNITVKDNQFNNSNSTAYGIQFQDGGADWWNITNNTFNITGANSYTVFWSSSAASNMSIWRNIFDGSGLHEVTREHDLQQLNFFCVNDGSGAVGNYHVNRSGRHHYVADCGPTPKVTAYNVDPDSNGRVIFSNSTSSAVANYTSISDAVANVNSTKSTINVSPARGRYNRSIEMKGIDNTTIECNRGEITGQNTGVAFSINEVANATIQNCNITNWTNAIESDSFGNFSSDRNIIYNNIFTNTIGAVILISDDLFDFTIIDNNTFGEAGGPHIHANAGGDNITVKNNNFTDVSGDTDSAIRFETSVPTQWNITNNTFNVTSESTIIHIVGAASGNHTIWRNNFYNNTNDAAADADANNWNISNLGNYWATFDSTAEGCTSTQGKEDAEGHTVCDTGFFFDTAKNDSIPSTEPFVILVDADNDTFFGNGANRTHPRDCDDSDPLVQPLRNHSVNYSINKTFTLCPGMVNTSILIQNDSVRLNCNSTTIVDRGVSGFGITIADNDNINITGCGIVNFTTGVSVLRSVNFRFINSTINNSGTGLFIASINASIIEGNQLYNLTANAIELRNASVGVNLSYNTIRNISGAESVLIEGNVANSTFNYNNLTNASYGIIFRGNTTSNGRPLNNTVSYNTIASMSVAGMSFQAVGAEPNRLENFSFANNTVQSSIQGIEIQSLYNSTFAFTTLTNNNRQLNITASNSTTFTNTSFVTAFVTFMNFGSNISTFNFTYSNTQGDVKFYNFTSGLFTRNVSVNSSGINISSSTIFVDNNSGLGVQAQITFRGISADKQPNVLRDNILCDPNTDCFAESFSAGAGTFVFNTTQMGTFTLTSQSFDELKAAGRTAQPPPPPPLPVVPVETTAAPSRSSTALKQLLAEEIGTSKRFAAGEGLGLVEASQDGVPVFINTKFGRSLILEPDKTSTLEMTVRNVVDYDIADLGLNIDAADIDVISMFPASVPLLKKDASTVFTLRLKARTEKKEQAINLLWTGVGARLEKKFDVRTEQRPQEKTARAFIFKRWLAPSLTVLVMFLTGTILLMGIQTFGTGQVQKVTQGVIGPIFRDTLVDEDTLRRLIRSKLLSHYGTLWVTRSAYLKFKPQFSQLKLVKLSTDSLRTATELNARFHIGMEMATLLAFATRKKLIAQLDLMPGKILTVRDLPSGVADEVDGIDIVNPFGTDVAPDKKLVLDSCISLPDYTGALMEHLVAGLTNGFTYSQLTSRLLATGWPPASVSKHLTALKAELGYLERHLLDVYYYAGFGQLDDEKTKEKAFTKLFEHGHDQRLVALAFKNITANYGQLSRFLAAGIARHTPIVRMVSQLVKQGWEQKIVDRALIAVESAAEEKESGKKEKTEKKNEKKEVKEPIAKKPAEKKHPTPHHSLPATIRQLSITPPLPLPTAAFTTPEKTSGIPFAYLAITRRDYDTAQAQRHAKEVLGPLRIDTSADFVAFKTKLLEKEISYLRASITRRVGEISASSLSGADMRERLNQHLAALVAGRHDRTLVERVAHDVCADVEKLRSYLAAVAGRPDVGSVRRELLAAGWDTTLIDKLVSAPTTRHALKAPEEKKLQPPTAISSIVQSLKESLARKVSEREEEYLRGAVEQLFAAAHRAKPVAELEKTFGTNATAQLVKKEYTKGLVESVVAEQLPALMARAREEERHRLKAHESREDKKEKKPDEKKKQLAVPPPSILSFIKEKIAAKEETYLRDYVERLFTEAHNKKPVAELEKTFGTDATVQLVKKEYTKGLVESVVAEQLPALMARAREEERQETERRLALQKKRGEHGVPQSLKPDNNKKPLPSFISVPSPSGIFGIIKEKIAAKEQAYLRGYAEQLFESAVQTKGFSAIRTTFVSDTITRLVSRGYHHDIVEQVVKEVFAHRSPAAAAEERKQHERRTLHLHQEQKKEKQPSQPAEKPANILAAVQRLIAGKEEDYILRFARQAFAAGKTAEYVVEKLVEKGHDAGVVRRMVRPISAPARQAPKQRPVPSFPPVKKVFTPPKTAQRLLLNQWLLDQILADHERGISFTTLRNQLQSQYGERLLSFHLSLAEKMSRKLKKQVRTP